MATIPIPETSISYESQKLREVLLPRETPSRDDAADAPPYFPIEETPRSLRLRHDVAADDLPYFPVDETPRTVRLRHELDQVSMSASALYVGGLVVIVVLGLAFL